MLDTWGTEDVVSYLTPPEPWSWATVKPQVAADAARLVKEILEGGGPQGPVSKQHYDAVILAGMAGGDNSLLKQLQAALVASLVDEGLEAPYAGIVALFGPPILSSLRCDEGGLSLSFLDYIGRGLRRVQAFQCQDLGGGRLVVTVESLRVLLVAEILRKFPSRVVEGARLGQLGHVERAVVVVRDFCARREAVQAERQRSNAAPEFFPPCIHRYLDSIAAGQAIGHSERFNLVAFLHKIGTPPDEIVDLFRASPGFDEARTRYQVDHIIGRRRYSRGGYNVMSCRKMRSMDICPDSGCPGKDPFRQYLALLEDSH